jgi:hypothetical protein
MRVHIQECAYILQGKSKVKVILRPTVSRPVCLRIKHPFGATVLTVAGLLIWGALSNKRTGLSFTIAAVNAEGYFYKYVNISFI